MRNIHKAMIALFCGGVFLMGIGTGIGFSEFTSFAYTGEITLGDVKMENKTIDYSFEPIGKKLKISYNRYFYGIDPDAKKLILDESVPENTVQFQVTYNENAGTPYLSYSSEDSEEPYVRMEYAWKQNDFEIFMTCKDRLLEDIKNKRIGSYKTVAVENIRILVNPATADLVTLN